MQVRGIRIALAAVGLADLEQEAAVLGEFQELVVVHRLRRRAVARAIVAAEPDIALIVDMDAVLALRPFIALSWAAPLLHDIAGGIEHHDGLRRHLLGVAFERVRAMDHPDIVLGIDGKAGRVADLHVRRKLRPILDHFEHRHAFRGRGLGGIRTGEPTARGNGQCTKNHTGEQCAFHGFLPFREAGAASLYSAATMRLLRPIGNRFATLERDPNFTKSDTRSRFLILSRFLRRTARAALPPH